MHLLVLLCPRLLFAPMPPERFQDWNHPALLALRSLVGPLDDARALCGGGLWGGEQGLLRVNEIVVPHLPKRKKNPPANANYCTPPLSLDNYPQLLKHGRNTLTVCVCAHARARALHGPWPAPVESAPRKPYRQVAGHLRRLRVHRCR